MDSEKEPPKIVTIGGGGGAPVIIRSLIEAGFSNISAVAAASDNGGRSGAVRTDERDRVISVGDLHRNLFALIPPDKASNKSVQTFMEWAAFTDGRGRNLGYTIYYSVLELCKGDFIEVQRQYEKILGISFLGVAIPATLEPAHINFRTEDGNVFSGEAELDRLSMAKDKVVSVWLDRPVSATKESVSAIKNADDIIICPGSLYGSIISPFLLDDIKAAYQSSPAKKILITNLTSDRNQTHRFTLIDYIKTFQQYTELEKPFDCIVCPNLSYQEFLKNHPKESASYAKEHSYFLGVEPEHIKAAQKRGIHVYPSNTYLITDKKHRIRHDPQKLAPVLKAIIK